MIHLQQLKIQFLSQMKWNGMFIPWLSAMSVFSPAESTVISIFLLLCSGPSGAWRVQNKAAMAKRDYLVEAAKQIRMALDSEVNEDYEAVQPQLLQQ